jgi:hypothetical protein
VKSNLVARISTRDTSKENASSQYTYYKEVSLNIVTHI